MINTTFNADIQNIIWTNTLAKIMVLIISGFFLLYCFCSTVVYVFFRDKYKGISFTTKNITYIAMLTAASVTLTVFISYLVPITVLPPVRISFEGLMIKISGLIFGPIIGVISGLITDMLCIMFIPSYFHIAYTLTIVFYGFMSGMSYFFSKKMKNEFVLYIISTSFILIFILFFTFFIQWFPISDYTSKSLSSLSDLGDSKYFLAIIIILSGTIVIFFQTILYIWYLISKSKIKKDGSINKIPLITKDIFPIMIVTVLTEYYISAVILPWGDSSLFGKGSYPVLLIYHVAEAPIKIFFNTIVIYITYRTIEPLIHRD